MLQELFNGDTEQVKQKHMCIPNTLRDHMNGYPPDLVDLCASVSNISLWGLTSLLTVVHVVTHTRPCAQVEGPWSPWSCILRELVSLGPKMSEIIC